MQSFDADIDNIAFSFIRVTYGSGELWYHISYEKDDKRITFRMLNTGNNTWHVYDTNDNVLLQLSDKLSECINDFENKLPAAQSKGDAIRAAAERLLKS